MTAPSAMAAFLFITKLWHLEKMCREPNVHCLFYGLFSDNIYSLLKINNFIRASEVRVIDEEGKNLGVLPLEKALQVAREAGLDLIEVSSNVVPPITKIMDKGKYLYEQDKKKRQAAKNRKEVEIKNVRIGIGTGAHDLELKARQIDEFLKEGNRAQVELRLKGREKYLKKEFLEERIQRVLNMVSQPFSIEPVKKGPRGLMLTIAPKK